MTSFDRHVQEALDVVRELPAREVRGPLDFSSAITYLSVMALGAMIALMLVTWLLS